MPSEKPILFSRAMSRAIHEGRKWMTRRVMVPQPHPDFLKRGVVRMVPQWPRQDGIRWFMADGLSELVQCPYKPGDLLWIREAWRTLRKWDDLSGQALGELGVTIPIQYECDHATRDWPKRQTNPLGRYRHARFMPRWAARTVRPITDVRAEQLQDITEEDAIAEGCEWMADESGTSGWHRGQPVPPLSGYSYVNRFRDLWDSINGDRPGCAWKDNPWVFSITFERVTPDGGED